MITFLPKSLPSDNEKLQRLSNPVTEPEYLYLLGNSF